MNLYQIRQKTAYIPNAKQRCKDALRTWIMGQKQDFQFAVTLTINQTLAVKNANGTYKRKLKREDCNAIARRFTQKLNREVFGKAAERHKKGLRYLITVEGCKNDKNMHFHMAVGRYPKDRMPMQFEGMVRSALKLVDELDEQYAVAVMDSGWMEYITKELNANNTDNVLWELA
jgi:hypothetical protein